MTRACILSKREGLRCLQRQLEMLAGASSDSTNADAVHDLRVACRRGRVMLAEFKKNFPPTARRAARKRLRKAGRRLGCVRELDVSLSLLDRWANSDLARAAALTEVRRYLETERTAAQPKLESAAQQVSGTDFTTTRTRLEAGFRPSTDCHLRLARIRLAKRLKRLNQQYRIWRKTRADEDLHLLRIRFKALRYSLEVHRGLYGNRATHFLGVLVAAQDALGQWNDYRHLLAHVRETAADANATPKTSKSLAELDAAIEADLTACVAAIESQLRPFFTKDESRRHEKLIASPKRPCCRGAR